MHLRKIHQMGKLNIDSKKQGFIPTYKLPQINVLKNFGLKVKFSLKIKEVKKKKHPVSFEIQALPPVFVSMVHFSTIRPPEQLVLERLQSDSNVL